LSDDFKMYILFICSAYERDGKGLWEKGGYVIKKVDHFN
jgi:hypothetical protein